MILRSVMKHVKDQNWAAVGIDFVIVVVGVFIGIQVANWNDSRAERDLEVRYLQRLETALGQDIVEHEDAVDLAEKRRELRNAAWEIHDLMWDWEAGTQRAVDPLDQFIVLLDRHIADRIRLGQA